MTSPAPVEVGAAAGSLRGYRWNGGPDLAVLLHDEGGDLDGWGDLPAFLAADGLGVLALDLPGHGMSDGEWTDGALGAAIGALGPYLTEEADGRHFLVAEGSVAGRLLFRPPPPRWTAVVAVAPVPPPATVSRAPQTPPALLLSDAHGRAATDAVFREARGWAVVSTFGAARGGKTLIHGPWAGHVREQIVAFLRDYRTPVPKP